MLETVVKRWIAWSGAEDVRRELTGRHAGAHLRRRRRMGIAATVGVLASLVVSLRQLGIVRRLPEPPGRIWDTGAVTTSGAAFVLGMPDGPVGALGFVLALVGAGRLAGAPPQRRPWTALSSLAVGGASAVGAALYLRDMFLREKKLCPYCLTTAAASFALLALSLPEGRALRVFRD